MKLAQLLIEIIIWYNNNTLQKIEYTHGQLHIQKIMDK